MKKEEFLSALRQELKSLPESEREEVIRDQEEYIREAILAGRSEESVLDSFGSPKSFAAGLSIESKIQKMENADSLKGQLSGTFGAVLAVMALAPLNLIFVLGPFMAIVGITMAGWAVSGAVLATSVAMLATWVFKLVLLPAGLFTHLSALFLGLGIAGVGCICLVVMAKATQVFIKATVAYLRFNLKLIQGRV